MGPSQQYQKIFLGVNLSNKWYTSKPVTMWGMNEMYILWVIFLGLDKEKGVWKW